MRSMSAVRAALGAVTLTCVLATGATANDVTAGHDLWTTPPGGAVEDFGGAIPPIPPDFFFPGSDPFTGVVEFEGQPLGGPSGPADTVVERQGNASLPVIPSTDTIPIEIVELQLVSLQPITVTTGGSPVSDWDVDVTLSGPNPSIGTMTINHTRNRGGNYDATLDVCPLLIFRELQPPFRIQQLDWCNAFLPQQIQVLGQPWSHTAVLPLVSPLSGPNFFVIGQTQHSGPHPQADPIEEAEGGPAVPSLSGRGMVALALVLIGAGAFAMHRLRRA